VGLEQLEKIYERIAKRMSPSHTVGLEQINELILSCVYIELESPSHPVGSERFCYRCSFVWFDYLVAIPPSGLKTSPKKLENPSLNILKTKTAHREGTLTHIQLPS
jgi:hypothetical protein